MFKKIILSYFVLMLNFIPLNANVTQQSIKNNLIEVMIAIKNSENLTKDLDFLMKTSRKNITINQEKLNKLNKTYNNLMISMNNLIQHKYSIQDNLFNLITKKYSISIIIQHSNKRSEQSVIDKATYTIIFNNIKNNIIKLNKLFKDINQRIDINKIKMAKLKLYIQEQEDLLLTNQHLKEEEISSIKFLKKQHSDYIEWLQKNYKKETITNEKKIVKYNNKNLPLKSYTIVERFSKDNINQQFISLKVNKKKSSVYSIMDGMVVFVRGNLNKANNIIMIKHKNNIFTIYSNFDYVSSKIRVGKHIRRGDYLGNINDLLKFQVTKGKKYLEPEQFLLNELKNING